MIYKVGEQVSQENNYIFSLTQDNRLIIKRTFEVDNATFIGERTLNLEITNNNPITGFKLMDHTVLVSYQEGQTKTYNTELKYLPRKFLTEYKSGHEPQLSIQDNQNRLTYCAQDGSFVAKGFDNTYRSLRNNGKCVGLFRLNKKQAAKILEEGYKTLFLTKQYAYQIVAVYDDNTFETMMPGDAQDYLYGLQKDLMALELSWASDAFKEQIEKMSPTKMTPDNFRVKNVMRTLHRQLLRLAKNDNYDKWYDFRKCTQARKILIALTAMAQDPNKTNQPIAYKPPKKTITNSKMGFLFAVSTAALLCATVALSVIFATIAIAPFAIGIATITFCAMITTGWASGHYLKKAGDTYAINKNINRFTNFARSPDSAPEKALHKFSRLAK